MFPGNLKPRANGRVGKTTKLLLESRIVFSLFVHEAGEIEYIPTATL